MADLHNKSILITGASSGIGAAIARAAAHAGARIVAHGRDVAKLEVVMASLPGTGHLSFVKDLSATEDGIEPWVDAIVEQAGPLAGFVHSAGYGKVEPLKVIRAAELDRIWRVNVAAAILIAKSMRKPANHAPEASILFLSSVAGLKGRPGQIAYAATKGALVAMARSMALELVNDKIRVNALAPAMVRTELFEQISRSNTPETMQRILNEHPSGLGETADVAAFACFLLSDEARWITGTTLPVDGGYSAG